MAKKAENAISPTREEDYPEWYQQVIKAADLAEASEVRGCMVIKPWGYSIWENMQRVLDSLIKETGHVNAYFPLFIPLSYLEKEAQHVEGFAKECAVVTHHRLEPGPDGKLIPTAKLEEPLIVRPTSETIIGAAYARWVQSYRDLPILINQWANVVRWELRTRMFLRTTEFLWQEGHTVHATADEALAETRQMLDVYARFAEEWMAMPVIKGEKTPKERFPGAVSTYSIEAMMQDRKALQAGTSHFLGQNFSRVQGIKYLSQEGKEEFGWTTSWGVTTRLIGGLIMTHSDDDGLILPPRLAPRHAVILPIFRTDEEKSQVLDFCGKLASELKHVDYDGGKLAVEIDARDIRGGEKTWHHIKRGVPLRLEVGPRDIANNSVAVARRDQAPKEKQFVPRDAVAATLPKTLAEIQACLFERAKSLREAATRRIDDRKEFEAFFTPKDEEKPEIHGGYALSHWADDPDTERLLKDLKVTVRCIPIDSEPEEGRCPISGQPSKRRVIYAKAY